MTPLRCSCGARHERPDALQFVGVQRTHDAAGALVLWTCPLCQTSLARTVQETLHEEMPR